MLLPCTLCSSIGSTEVRYYCQTKKSKREVNTTAGAICTQKQLENDIHVYNANCSDLNLCCYDSRFEADCDSVVDSTRSVCDSDLPLCTYGQSQTDMQHIAQITTTPVLTSTTLSAQSNFTGFATPSVLSSIPSPSNAPTGAASEPTPSVLSSIPSPSNAPTGAASKPTPSVPSSIPSPSNALAGAPDCMPGRVSCHIVCLAVGLGALAVIVMLLVVVVIVLVCISVKRGKKKMQSERECILLCVVVASNFPA